MAGIPNPCECHRDEPVRQLYKRNLDRVRRAYVDQRRRPQRDLQCSRAEEPGALKTCDGHGKTGGRRVSGPLYKGFHVVPVSDVAPHANTLMRGRLRATAEDTPMPAAKPAAKPAGKAIKGYCVRCRVTREIKDPKRIVMKNGKPAWKGKCPVCGTGMFRIGG